MKNLMDNQLKNVKTHARLLSKSMWYDWRMTLLGTLKEGLFKTAEGMIQDEEILDKQQVLLEAVLPHLVQEASKLEQQEVELITIDADIEAKKQLIASLKKKLEGKEVEISAANQKKEMWLEEIREAEKIREECRGWTSGEISILKGMRITPLPRHIAKFLF